MGATKINFFHNSSHTQLRVSQGVPESMAVLPNNSSDASDIMSFNVNRIVHVSSPSGKKEHVHLYCTSTSNTDVFIEIISNNGLVNSGNLQRAASWPKRELVLQVKANQPSPQIVLQGFTISAGAAISACSMDPGVMFFGFVVQNDSFRRGRYVRSRRTTIPLEVDFVRTERK